MIKSGIRFTAFDAIKVYLPYSFVVFDMDCFEEMKDEMKYTESVYSLWFPVVAAVWNVVACTARRFRFSLSIL
jgi:protein associated with RNAse G/E